MAKFHLIYTRWAALSSREIFRDIHTFFNDIKQNLKSAIWNILTNIVDPPALKVRLWRGGINWKSLAPSTLTSFKIPCSPQDTLRWIFDIPLFSVLCLLFSVRVNLWNLWLIIIELLVWIRVNSWLNIIEFSAFSASGVYPRCLLTWLWVYPRCMPTCFSAGGRGWR